MCGRFVSTQNPDKIAAYFDAESDVDSLGENFNVAPTQDIYAVVTGPDGVTRVQAFHWGLIPSWAKDRKIASRMINARSETIASKPAYKGLFKAKRCIIPMDGFYEWKPGAPDGPVSAKGRPLKQPMFISRLDGEPLAVAGLWTAWKDTEDPEHRYLHSATIVTRAANETMQPIHDRMPVLIPKSRWAEWLDPSNQASDELASLFTAPDDHSLGLVPVSREVNNVRNNGPELIVPVDPDE
jgi:putative SOS response-associated peptidase YedK